ncbi:bifunctional metallophosphatase/5'-nucleotidase [Acidobacteriota bacterium]
MNNNFFLRSSESGRTPFNSRLGSLFLTCSLILSLSVDLLGEKIHILHSNDSHGTFKAYPVIVKGKRRMVGGMEASSHYVNRIRDQYENVFLIDTGDVMTGTMAAEVGYKGVIGGAMIEFLNLMKYDVRCLGNHDFDRGQENAIYQMRLAEFPTVMANLVYAKDGSLFPVKPFHIFDVQGIKIGVTAVMEENFLTEVLKEKVEGLDVLPAIPTLKAYMPTLEKLSDLIIVLVHDKFQNGLDVASHVPGVDIVLVASEDGRFAKVNDVLVKSTVGHQQTMGYLELEVKDGRIVDYKEDLIWLWADEDLNPSPEIKLLIDDVEKSIGSDYGEIIGDSKTDHFCKGVGVESSLGNWITDVMLWSTKAKIAFHNTGGIRSDILTGSISKADVFAVSPFFNTLVLFNLTGQQIKDLLEYDIEKKRDKLQVAGLQYSYLSKERKKYGQRVQTIEINGDVLVRNGIVLHPDRVFKVVSNNYLTGHAESKYFGFHVDGIKTTGESLDSALLRWLKKNKVLNYRVEGRIKKLKTSY